MNGRFDGWARARVCACLDRRVLARLWLTRAPTWPPDSRARVRVNANDRDERVDDDSTRVDAGWETRRGLDDEQDDDDDDDGIFGIFVVVSTTHSKGNERTRGTRTGD